MSSPLAMIPSVNRNPAASSKSFPGVRIVTARLFVTTPSFPGMSSRISIGSSTTRTSSARSPLPLATFFTARRDVGPALHGIAGPDAEPAGVLFAHQDRIPRSADHRVDIALNHAVELLPPTGAEEERTLREIELRREERRAPRATVWGGELAVLAQARSPPLHPGAPRAKGF